ncbi:TPA: hypothetical protein ACH3X2_014153, partial [Trebouxia sp. C0005]
GTTGRVLQKAQYLVEMEHAKHVRSHPLLASESTFLVLWLPSTYQRQPKQRNRVSSGILRIDICAQAMIFCLDEHGRVCVKSNR